MGAIYRGPKRGYVMTDDDVLWLARALGGEAKQDEKSAAWHAWSWMDRFHLWKYSDTHFKEFWELIRAHSKAVNPKWMTPGRDKCADRPQDCEPDKIKYREYWCSLTPEQLQEAGLWQLAKSFQEGKLPRPTGEPIPDFAADWLIKNQKRPCMGYCVGPTGHQQCFLPLSCLFEDERAAILDGDVRVEWGVEKIGWTAVGLLFATGVGWAIYTLIRR
jgi:hypothetical protein